MVHGLTGRAVASAPGKRTRGLAVSDDEPPPGRVVVEGLTFHYPPSPAAAEGGPALSDVSFRVEPGRVLGVLGTGGSGKTTLCLALNGIVPRRTGGAFAGRVVVGGWDTRHRPIAAMATRVALVFQEPEANFVGLSVEDEVAFGPENLGVPPPEIERRVVRALSQVDMAEHRAAGTARLSGGQKQRVAIAAALAMRPSVLVLDEPTAALDPVGSDEVLTVLAALKRDGESSILFVSQDADAIAALADDVIALDAGRIVLAGAPEAVFAPSHIPTLRRLGLPIPTVAEVAAGLNDRLGTEFAFLTSNHAAAVLAAALGGP
jgi:energy-coupling factor transporter ATP-binding protein EcfA2